MKCVSRKKKPWDERGLFDRPDQGVRGRVELMSSGAKSGANSRAIGQETANYPFFKASCHQFR